MGAYDIYEKRGMERVLWRDMEYPVANQGQVRTLQPLNPSRKQQALSRKPVTLNLDLLDSRVQGSRPRGSLMPLAFGASSLILRVLSSC